MTSELPLETHSTNPEDNGLLASILVVSYNGWLHLEGLLQSLYQDAGHTSPDQEIILVDNGSSDGTPQYVEQLFPEVRLVCNKTNLGLAAAWNQAARLAKGRYLAFLNQDIRVESGWLPPLIAALETDPQAGLVTSKVLLMQEPEKINTCGNRMHMTGVTRCNGLNASRQSFAQVQEVDAISGASFVIRKSVFEKLGGFDEDFFMYVEDTDLSWRARLAGYRCLLAPGSIVYHDYVWHTGPHKIYWQERNRYWMLLKSLRWPTFLVLLPALLLAELIVWGFVLIYEPQRWSNKLRAYASVWSHWRAVMVKRRALQKLRRVRDRDLLLQNAHRLAFENNAQGWLANLAHLLFDPLFWLCRAHVWLLVWW